MSVRDHRTNRQPVVRNWTAVDAWQRTSAGTMGRTGKGRTRRDNRTRQSVRSSLRRGEF